MDDERITPTPENPIPDVDEVKPGIPTPAWADEGGGDLPAVTSEDAGKVLTVSNDGEWVAGEGGGGSGGANLLIATVDLGTGVLDKTWNEINNADYCVAMTTSDGKTFMPIYEIYEDSGAYFVSFTPLGSTTVTFEASSADGYPVMSQ